MPDSLSSVSSDSFSSAGEEYDDFSDLDLPDPDQFPKYIWSNDNTDIIRYPNGYMYEGKISHNNERTGIGKLFTADKHQYIKGEWHKDTLLKLHYAQLQFNDTEYVRLCGQDRLLTSNEHNLVARIAFMKDPLNIECKDFITIRRDIMCTITVVRILDDDLRDRLLAGRNKFAQVFQARAVQACSNRTVLQDIFYIDGILRQQLLDCHGNIELLTKIKSEKNISESLRLCVEIMLDVERNVLKRNSHLPKFQFPDKPFIWRSTLETCLADAVINIKNAIQNAAPTSDFISSSILDINSLTNHQIYSLNPNDVKLFSNLQIILQQHQFSSVTLTMDFNAFFRLYLSNLWNLIMKQVKTSRKENKVYRVVNFSNPVFLQLFKTLLGLLEDLCIRSCLSLKEIISIDDVGNLTLMNFDNRAIEKAMLVCRTKFIIRLLIHFTPGNLKVKEFEYNFSVFQVTKNSRWQNPVSLISKVVKKSELSSIPEEYLIWLYYIHNYFTNRFNENTIQNTENVQDLYNILNFFLSTFKNIITDKEYSFEKVRILSRNMIHFVESISSQLLGNTLLDESEASLLIKQCDYMLALNDNFIDSITNTLEYFQKYWEQQSNLRTLFTNQFNILPLSAETDLIMSNINSLVHSALDLEIHSDKFVVFLRSCNEFIKFLSSSKLTWFIKIQDKLSGYNAKEVNKSKESYEVDDVAKYIRECIIINYVFPKHYIFGIVQDMIICAANFLKTSTWHVNDKMQAASDLLLAMGRSMIHFEEQANYGNYENFSNACTHPFIRVTEDSSSIKDFNRRISNLEDYYFYMKDVTDISIDRVLNMCSAKCIDMRNNRIDYTLDTHILHDCYNTYSEHFKCCIGKHISQEPSWTIQDIVRLVKNDGTFEHLTSLTKWNVELKRTYLPKLLARISAVWSIIESKNVIGQRKIIKPHCIQILCVLRLLGVDQDTDGFDNHLAQVLTGQGKSIVLALLSAMLALTGKRVRVVCYNQYLATRDQKIFLPFYQIFGVETAIEYGTFNDMANNILEPKINGHRYELRTCISKLITDTLEVPNTNRQALCVPSETILLIDEIDVFLSHQFYGAKYSAGAVLQSESIAKIQLRIWDMVSVNWDKHTIKSKTTDYADTIFRNDCDTTFYQIYLKSKPLLHKHLNTMIDNALNVKKGTHWSISRYRLNENNRIIFILDNGEHSTITYVSYYNVFNYFRLKQYNFDHDNLGNFGYLQLSCGAVSCATLPNEHCKILGVTGTLTTLNKPEVNAVLSYNITRASNMPSFFGSSKLVFNNQQDFKICDNEADWMKDILNSIRKHIQNSRAVLVFVDKEQIIHRLKANFESHIARIHILTGNEDVLELERCVDEAGVASTVTMAMRTMGRGVDFKSNDSLVESKGGVHVIQTFFSTDVKEEIQIKGRTARKDNAGSYELILCRKHLQDIGYGNTGCGIRINTYGDLSRLRQARAETKANEIAQSIEKSRKVHDATMHVLRSFYNYDPTKRNEYFSKYPFVDLE